MVDQGQGNQTNMVNLVYTDAHFRRRFRMRRHLFWKIHNAICEHDDYFIQKRHAAGKLGLSSIQKITAALCQLSLGVSTDAMDEYCRIAETTALESLKRFAGPYVRCLRHIISDNLLKQTWTNNSLSMRPEDFVRCLAH